MRRLAFASVMGMVVALSGAAQGGEREARLSELFAALLVADDGESAADLREEIEAIWHDAGSAGMNLVFLRAKSAMEAGNLEAALVHLDDLVRLAPQFAEGWNARATVHYHLGNHDRSLSDIGETLRREPRHFGAMSGLGLVMIALGKPAAALRAYRSALAVHPWLEGPQMMVRKLEKLLERDI